MPDDRITSPARGASCEKQPLLPDSCLFQRLFELAPDATLVIDREGRVAHVNMETEKLFGYPRRELVGEPVEILIPERFRGQHVKQRSQYFDHPTVRPMGTGLELYGRRKDGSEFPADISLNPLDTREGMLITATIRDVSERTRAEVERHRLLGQLRLQIERLPLGYLLSGSDFRYAHWNPAAEETFGYTKAEVLGKHPFDVIVAPQCRPFVEAVFKRLQAGDMHAHGSWESVTKDGRTIVCEWHNTPLLDADGTFQGLLCLAEDVTEKRSWEERYRQAQKMEAIGQLAGGVAHDFNNLLTIINGYSELLLQKLPADDPSRDLLQEIHGAGERSASLTRQLLAFSRKQVLARRPLDLNKVVADTEKLLRRIIGEDLHFHLSLAPGLGTVQADSGQMEQVLLNLVINARDAMPRGGNLTIETANIEVDENWTNSHAGVRSGPHVLLAVSDSGCGMTAEVKNRIFEPFFTTKAAGKGTGLGLAVVHGIVQQAGGRVEVYSEVDVGTTFKIYIPQIKLAARDPSQSHSKILPKGTETILLAEDENGVRALSRQILTGSGYSVLEAADGKEALRIAIGHRKPIHLLVTDVVMPGLGGRQVAEQVLRLHPEAKVLFLSGYTDDAVVHHGILHEEVQFLQKPFAPFALACKVREVLDSTCAFPGAVAGHSLHPCG
jgi:two-component system cell cycle sensor histidine kinase/response regulator CckA